MGADFSHRCTRSTDLVVRPLTADETGDIGVITAALRINMREYGLELLIRKACVAAVELMFRHGVKENRIGVPAEGFGLMLTALSSSACPSTKRSRCGSWPG